MTAALGGLLGLGLFALAALGVGVPTADAALGREARALELGTLSVAFAALAIYLVELGRHALGLGAGWATGALVLLGVTGLAIRRARVQELARDPGAREALFALSATLLALLGLTATIHTFGGGDWQADWIGHYRRTLYWLEPASAPPIGWGDRIPSRPPLANLLAASFLAASGPSFAHYQVAMTALAACLVLPLAWVLEAAGQPRRAASTIGALLLVSPVFVQNATYPWTKLVAAYFVIAGLRLAWRAAHGAPPLVAGLAGAMLGTATVAHYSSAPWLLLALAALTWALLRRRDARSGVAAGVGLALAAGPWLAFSVGRWGAETTWAPFAAGSADAAHLARAAADLHATFAPHPMRGVPLDAIEQSSRPGWLRDYVFLLYQPGALAGAGLAGALAVARALGEPSLRRATGLGLAASLPVVALIAWAHPWPAPFGLAHIGLTPLCLLGLVLVARLWRRGRGWAFAVLALLLIDLALGVGLHFGLQAQEVAADGSGLAASLAESVRANRALAVDSAVQTWGERLGAARVAGFVAYGVGLAALAWRSGMARGLGGRG